MAMSSHRLLGSGPFTFAISLLSAFVTAVALSDTLFICAQNLSLQSIVTPSYGMDCFPDGFLFGSATSAYQVEGAVDADGRGESIWDRMTKERPDAVLDRSSGAVACDSYHRYKDDVAMLKDLGVDFYRLSVSWSRILPTGMTSSINEKGLDYYNRLINELLDNGIQPVVTIHHWDLPQPLQELGGWMNPAMAEIFEDFARVLFTNFGDRVKWWITVNEPRHIGFSYSEGVFNAPQLKLHDQGGHLLATRTFLQANALAYHLYDTEFRPTQKGKIGITLHGLWFEPKTNSVEDREAANLALQLDLGIFAHPIFSREGDYPNEVKQLYEQRSKEWGLFRSLLPELGEEWINKIRGTSDFFGLNFYTSRLVTPGEEDWWLRDTGIAISVDPAWPDTANRYMKETPFGLRKLLQWIKTQYDDPPIFITENGFPDHGEQEDDGRIRYHVGHLRAILNAIHCDGCKVLGYTAWSLMDNFEWAEGYTQKFGLFHVDFNDPNRKRTPKKSAKVLSSIFKTRRLPKE